MAARKPVWVEEALKHIGQKEIPGVKSNVWILSLWIKVTPWLGNDDSKVPWCGAFMRHCFVTAKVDTPKAYYRAKEWLNWGVKLAAPIPGCVVVFDRVGGGHVGIVMGYDAKGNLMVLGGNQGDAVNIRPFAVSRVSGYRWPTGVATPKSTKMPLMASNGQVSTNEA